MFIDGSIVLFKAALGIFKTIQEGDIESLEERTENLKDSSNLVYYLLLRKFEFDIHSINKNRNKLELSFKRASEEKLKQRQEHGNSVCKVQRRNSIYEKDFACLTELPLCIYDTTYKDEILNYSVLTVFNPPKIIEDYFFKMLIYDEASSNYSINSNKHGYLSRNSDAHNQSMEIDLRNSFDSRSTDSEGGKLNLFKNVLIARRTHYCKNYQKKNKKSLNKSFPDLHPYFHDFECMKPDSGFYSKYISSLRNTSEQEIINSDIFVNFSPNFENILNYDESL
jgi:hypothetical protein